MLVKDVMTEKCEFIKPDATLQEAAQRMRDLDCGFLAIGPEENNKLEGVITDRDIVIRCVSEGMDPTTAHVRDAETRRVMYCYQTDDLESATRSMRDQQVYRLIVLDNPESKQLCGVVSWGDIVRHHEDHLAIDAAEGIKAVA